MSPLIKGLQQHMSHKPGTKRPREEENDDYLTSNVGSAYKKLRSEATTAGIPTGPRARPAGRAGTSYGTRQSRLPVVASTRRGFRQADLRPPSVRPFPMTLLPDRTEKYGGASTIAPLKRTASTLHPPLTPMSTSGLASRSIRPLVLKDVIPGMIIAMPWHTTALDPHAKSRRNSSFISGPFGTVCTKRRLGIAISATLKSIFVLPITSHSGRGNQHLALEQRRAEIRLRNYDKRPARDDPNRDDYLVVTLGKVTDMSSVDLDDGAHVAFVEDVRAFGYIDRDSTERLIRRHETLVNEAKAAIRGQDPGLAAEDKTA